MAEVLSILLLHIDNVVPSSNETFGTLFLLADNSLTWVVDFASCKRVPTRSVGCGL